MRIAVVGLGISGATMAAAALACGLDVVVFEQAPEMREVGAGLTIGPHAMRLFARIGAYDRLAAVSGPILRTDVKTYQGQIIHSMIHPPQEDGVVGRNFHRAELLNAIAEVLPLERVRLSHQCIGVQEDDTGVTLRFANGVEERFDAVIGADGIHSAVLSAVVGASPPVYSGLAAYRGVVPADRVPDLYPSALYTDNYRYFVHFPISNGRLINFVGVVPHASAMTESWSKHGAIEDLRNEYAGWDANLLRLIDAIDETFLWGLYYREPIARYATDRIALIGDAAHPMFIHGGQAGAQAIEDAFTAAYVLSDAAPATVPARLRLYQSLRRERCIKVQEFIRRNADFLHHKAPGRETEGAPQGMGDVSWLYSHDAERAFAAARSAFA